MPCIIFWEVGEKEIVNRDEASITYDYNNCITELYVNELKNKKRQMHGMAIAQRIKGTPGITG